MAQRILIVDDDPDMVQVSSLILTRMGYDCAGTTSAVNVLALARDTQPDLIILDDMMPELSGLEVLWRLRSDPVTQPIPILFCTVRERDQLNSYLNPKNDPVGYVQKPYDIGELRQIVRDMLPPEAE